jgi:hypothetical protein
MVPLAPTANPLFVSIKEKSCSVLHCGSGFCQTHCRPDEPAAILFDGVAASRLPAYPLLIVSVSPQAPIRLTISNAVFRCVFICVPNRQLASVQPQAVGRGLGVGLALGVGVALGVGLAVGVGVELGVAVGVGVGVGVARSAA